MSTPDPNMRVSNAEREAIIARLHAATEEGRLDLDEFAERSSQAYEAKTYAEVERLLTDLPPADGALAVPNGPKPNETVPDLQLRPNMASVERKGEWTAPSRITVDGSMSSAKLDFRHATFTSREVDIDVNLSFSSVEIVLPRDAAATADNIDLTGSSVTNKCHHNGQTGPRIAVAGRGNFSSVTIRYERRFLWWRW